MPASSASDAGVLRRYRLHATGAFLLPCLKPAQVIAISVLPTFWAV
jgi:hypothetical protein